MDAPVRHKAIISVARGCGFGGLAAVTAMLGFAHDPPAAVKFGGMSSLLTALVLLAKASRARFSPYKRTEIWLMLEANERPPAIFAQLVIGEARRCAAAICAGARIVCARLFSCAGAGAPAGRPGLSIPVKHAA